MNSWIYPDAVKIIEDACGKFLNGELDEVALQEMLYEAEQKIVAYEEAWFRTLLFDVENKIEEIIYMESSGNQVLMLRKVVQGLLCVIKDNSS